MNKYPDFWHTLIGNGSIGAFLGFMVIGYICAMVSLLIEASTRSLSSTNTPVKFSWHFLWASNLLRLIANLLLIPIVIRLVYEYVDAKWMLFLAIGIGAGVDGLAMIFKNIGLLTTNKLAAKVAEKLAPTDPTITPKP